LLIVSYGQAVVEQTLGKGYAWIVTKVYGTHCFYFFGWRKVVNVISG
jgi:hypothetical protein